jgi:hypothetical protein
MAAEPPYRLRRPRSLAQLIRNFKNELASEHAMLKARVAGKFYAALDNNQPWAIQMGLRNQCGWDNGRSGFQVDRRGDDGGVEPARFQ